MMQMQTNFHLNANANVSSNEYVHCKNANAIIKIYFAFIRSKIFISTKISQIFKIAPHNRDQRKLDNENNESSFQQNMCHLSLIKIGDHYRDVNSRHDNLPSSSGLDGFTH